MKETWLLLDVSFLAYRAFYTTGHLTHHDIKTGVLFGLLRDIPSLQNQFNTNHIAFCFDSKHSLRKEIYPEYKGDRRKNSDEETHKALHELRKQITKLRRKYLPEMGFRNIFIQKGYEADDMIAEICFHHWRDDSKEFIIISSDSDMHQLINGQVTMWDPIKNKIVTPQSIFKKYGVKPIAWYLVRAIAGGKDNIPGVKGVGIKTACKHVQGTTTARLEKRIQENEKLIKRNLMLVQLPFPDTKPCTLKPDLVTWEKWSKVVSRLGMESLKKYAPYRLRTQYR